MAKRGRKPKSKVIGDLEESLQNEINEAIRSHADASAASLYRRFGLQGRGLVFSTFRKHVRKIRQRSQGERIALGAIHTSEKLSEADLIAKLRRQILVAALEDIEAGDTKLYEAVGMLARVQDFDRIAILREAEDRAAELHRVKFEQLSKDLRKDVDERTEGDKKLSREDVYDMIDKVMRGEQ